MERLQGATLTISLVNGACYTLTNRFLKAHAEAWYNFKNSNDSLIGMLVPLAFHVMIIAVTEENLWAVREIRQHLGGVSEHQDLAPHELDVQRDTEQATEGDWNPSTDEAFEGGFWGTESDDQMRVRSDENDQAGYGED